MSTSAAAVDVRPEGATATYSLWVPPSATRSFRWLAAWREAAAGMGFEPCGEEPYLLERDHHRFLVGWVRPQR